MLNAKQIKKMSIEQLDAEVKKTKDFLAKNSTGEEAYHARHDLKKLTAEVVKRRTEELALAKAQLEGMKAAEAARQVARKRLKL